MASSCAPTAMVVVPLPPARWAVTAAAATAMLRRWAATGAAARAPPQAAAHVVVLPGAHAAVETGPAHGAAVMKAEVCAVVNPAPLPLVVATGGCGAATNGAADTATDAATGTVAVAGMKRRRAPVKDNAAAAGVLLTRTARATAPDAAVCKARACPHGRRHIRCVECGGQGICEHGRERYHCKECAGAGICVHGRQRSRCKECGGAGICEHGRRRTRCKECGGASICEHGRQRCQCKECGGGSICVHGRVRYDCKECVGVCTHGHLAKRCRDCRAATAEALPPS